MSTELNYLDLNRNLWNDKTAVHLESDFYDLEGFVAGKTSLNSIELDLLGDVRGEDVLHLQCHFGQDTLSMARMGAKVTGIDLSDAAIAAARDLNQKTKQEARFEICDVYKVPEVIEGNFDTVFTTYGTIGWLPDLDRWANVISTMLKPGGRLVFVEFHPVLWMFDDDQKEVGYSYFNTGVIEEVETGTYTDRDADLSGKYMSWNHDLGEVLSSLLNAGLSITHMQEYDYSPYNIFADGVEAAPGRYQVRGKEGKLPLVYSVGAQKAL